MIIPRFMERVVGKPMMIPDSRRRAQSARERRKRKERRVEKERDGPCPT